MKKASYSTDELYNLWTMLEQVHSGITLARDRELEQHGLSTIKASALFIVQSIGNEATPAEISTSLKLRNAILKPSAVKWFKEKRFNKQL